MQILNCGNNDLEDLPEVLEYLTMLEKLHLFNNNLITLNPKVLSMYMYIESSVPFLFVISQNNDKSDLFFIIFLGINLLL